MLILLTPLMHFQNNIAIVLLVFASWEDNQMHKGV